MGSMLCCSLKKKYNQIDANHYNHGTNNRTNLFRRNKKYKRPEYKNQLQINTFILNDKQLQSFDDILLNNIKGEQQNNNKKKSDIYRKWRNHYLNNSGKLYI